MGGGVLSHRFVFATGGAGNLCSCVRYPLGEKNRVERKLQSGSAATDPHFVGFFFFFPGLRTVLLSLPISQERTVRSSSTVSTCVGCVNIS